MEVQKQDIVLLIVDTYQTIMQSPIALKTYSI
jgi:hypothetical protein